MRKYIFLILLLLPLRARAKALISIAHPAFRDWLREEFERVYRMKL